jgi:3-oxoacyl-[acyl-carrier protein] reductase
LVNAVAPGYVGTELTKINNTPEQIEIIKSNLPINRLAEPSEIAELVYFLASEKNTFVTGQTIFADGGYSIV